MVIPTITPENWESTLVASFEDVEYKSKDWFRMIFIFFVNFTGFTYPMLSDGAVQESLIGRQLTQDEYSIQLVLETHVRETHLRDGYTISAEDFHNATGQLQSHVSDYFVSDIYHQRQEELSTTGRITVNHNGQVTHHHHHHHYTLMNVTAGVIRGNVGALIEHTGDNTYNDTPPPNASESAERSGRKMKSKAKKKPKGKSTERSLRTREPNVNLFIGEHARPGTACSSTLTFRSGTAPSSASNGGSRRSQRSSGRTVSKPPRKVERRSIPELTRLNWRSVLDEHVSALEVHSNDWIRCTLVHFVNDTGYTYPMLLLHKVQEALIGRTLANKESPIVLMPGLKRGLLAKAFHNATKEPLQGQLRTHVSKYFVSDLYLERQEQWLAAGHTDGLHAEAGAEQEGMDFEESQESRDDNLDEDEDEDVDMAQNPFRSSNRAGSGNVNPFAGEHTRHGASRRPGASNPTLISGTAQSASSKATPHSGANPFSGPKSSPSAAARVASAGPRAPAPEEAGAKGAARGGKPDVGPDASESLRKLLGLLAKGREALAQAKVIADALEIEDLASLPLDSPEWTAIVNELQLFSNLSDECLVAIAPAIPANVRATVQWDERLMSRMGVKPPPAAATSHNNTRAAAEAAVQQRSAGAAPPAGAAAPAPHAAPGFGPLPMPPLFYGYPVGYPQGFSPGPQYLGGAQYQQPQYSQPVYPHPAAGGPPPPQGPPVGPLPPAPAQQAGPSVPAPDSSTGEGTQPTSSQVARNFVAL